MLRFKSIICVHCHYNFFNLVFFDMGIMTTLLYRGYTTDKYIADICLDNKVCIDEPNISIDELSFLESECVVLLGYYYPVKDLEYLLKFFKKVEVLCNSKVADEINAFGNGSIVPTTNPSIAVDDYDMYKLIIDGYNGVEEGICYIKGLEHGAKNPSEFGKQWYDIITKYNMSLVEQRINTYGNKVNINFRNKVYNYITVQANELFDATVHLLRDNCGETKDDGSVFHGYCVYSKIKFRPKDEEPVHGFLIYMSCEVKDVMSKYIAKQNIPKMIEQLIPDLPEDRFIKRDVYSTLFMLTNPQAKLLLTELN